MAEIFGIDFTSAPTIRKPITCAYGHCDGDRLVIDSIEAWPSLNDFDAFLRRPGVWTAGLDFPFGFAHRFVTNIGWSTVWTDYIKHIDALSKPAFVEALDRYRDNRAAGDREHLRATDRTVGAMSPQKLYGVPVAKMLFVGAPMLLHAPVDIWPLRLERSERAVVEDYPGYMVRQLVGRLPYKHDNSVNDADQRRNCRAEILKNLSSITGLACFGLQLKMPESLKRQCVDDRRGDLLDAVLAAMHAAAWRKNEQSIGDLPAVARTCEGWIPNLIA